MFRIITQDINEYYAKMGLVFRYEIGAVIALATTGTYHVGVTTGAAPVRVLYRSYSSSESPLTIELFEATWSAGATVRVLNANLGIAGSPPATMFGAVTPGTLGAVITSASLRAPTAGGSAQLTVTADSSVLILKAGTSYVLRFTNGGGINASVGAVINLRNMQPEE